MEARIENIEVLSTFKIALIKFQEHANSALGDAESDVNRTIQWLESEQQMYWQTQIRRRQEEMTRAEEALRQKKIFRDSSGAIPSAVEEQKMVTKCRQKLEEAQHKLAAVKMWSKRLNKELTLYKGQVQRFVTSVTSDVPAAISHLGALIHTLEEYAAIQPGQEVALDPAMAAFFSGEGGGEAVMSRGAATTRVEPYVHLRARVPSDETRKNATAGTPAQWIAAPLSDDDKQMFRELELKWNAPAPTDKVIIAKSASISNRLFMERATDSAGWYIGPLEGVENELETITVGELLAVRPDWEKALALPPGYMVVIDRGGVAAVLDEQNKNIWVAKADQA